MSGPYGWLMSANTGLMCVLSTLAKVRQSNLSRPVIVTAALALIDEEGLASLNMRRLAARLGTKPMSLYRHIANKAALLDAVADAVLAETQVASQPTDPLGDALDAVRAFRRALLGHPNIVPLFAGPGVVAGSTEQFALLEAALEAGAQVGLDARESLRAYAIVLAYVVGFVVREVASPTTVAFDQTSDPAWLGRIAQLPPTEFPHLHELSHDVPAAEDLNGLFEMGLAAILRGLIPA